MLSDAGDLCGRCGFLVTEVYTLACRCSMVRREQANGVGYHLVQVCSCYFPAFQPKCADPASRYPLDARNIGPGSSLKMIL